MPSPWGEGVKIPDFDGWGGKPPSRNAPHLINE